MGSLQTVLKPLGLEATKLYTVHVHVHACRSQQQEYYLKSVIENRKLWLLFFTLMAEVVFGFTFCVPFLFISVWNSALSHTCTHAHTHTTHKHTHTQNTTCRHTIGEVTTLFLNFLLYTAKNTKFSLRHTHTYMYMYIHTNT